jgi:hypothetical protein
VSTWTRAECPTARPCPRACRYRLDDPGPGFGECALDWSSIPGGLTLDEVAQLLGGVRREAVRVVEARALVKLRRGLRRLDERAGDWITPTAVSYGSSEADDEAA